MEISQNMFYITIAAIVLLGLVVVVIEWRMARGSKKSIELLSKMAEQKKIEREERGLENEDVLSDIVLPKEQEEKLTYINKSISYLMQKEGCLPIQINERFKRLEASTRSSKFQKLLRQIDE